MRTSEQPTAETDLGGRAGGKGWFLTYPKCGLDKETLVVVLSSFSPHPVEEYIVARELHGDGEPHLHCFVKFQNKVVLDKNGRKFDFLGHHGNYQVAKSWRAVQAYCKKGDDYISNISVESAQQGKAKRSVDILTRTDLKSLVEDGTIGALQLVQAQKARQAWALLEEPEDQPDVRGIWIHGPSGSGKTHLVTHKEPLLYKKPQNKWWDGYEGQPAVLLDDFDCKGQGLDHLLKIWTDKWSCKGETKGGTIPLNYQRFYVTSNFTIEHLFRDSEEETIKAIRRRFKVVYKPDRTLGLGTHRSRSRSEEKPRHSLINLD